MVLDKQNMGLRLSALMLNKIVLVVFSEETHFMSPVRCSLRSPTQILSKFFFGLIGTCKRSLLSIGDFLLFVSYFRLG